MKQFFGIISIALALSLSACLPSFGERAPTVAAVPLAAVPVTETIHLSMLLPLSGKNAALGTALQNAATLAINDLKSDGIEIEFQDTQSTPEGAKIAAQKAISQNTRLVLGPIFADDVRAARSVMAATTIPMIAFSTDMSVASLGTFIMGVLPQDQARQIAAFAATRGARNTLIIAPNDPYGQLMVHTYSLVFRSAGGGITGPLLISPTDTDEVLSGKIAGAFSANSGVKIDAAFLPLSPARAAKIIDTVTRFVGTDRPIILGTGAWEETDATTLPALSGAFYAAPSSDLRTQFEGTYRQNFEATPPRLAALSYDSVALAITLGRTLGATGYTFTSLTNSSGFSGINGLFRFKTDGTVERSLSIMSIQQGGPRVITPGLSAFTPIIR